jgi:hypothetical protein
MLKKTGADLRKLSGSVSGKKLVKIGAVFDKATRKTRAGFRQKNGIQQGLRNNRWNRSPGG